MSENELGQGLYAANEIARFTVLEFNDVRPATATQWLRHVVQPRNHEARRPDYSFRSLISVLTIAALREQGVPLQKVRHAHEQLSGLLDDPEPFARGGIFTDGRRVFAALDVPGQLTDLNTDGEHVAQEAARKPLEQFLVSVRYRDAKKMQDRTAEAWLPSKGVTVDPEIQFGAPCITGRRVPTATIYALVHERKLTPKQVAEEYDLTALQVKQALAFEDAIAAVAA